MAKLREQRLRKCRQQKELARAIGCDEPMLSKFENYKCIPIPPMMKLILKELECEIEDIYEPNEIYLTPEIKQSTEKKDERDSNYYKLTVRLPKDSKEFLKKALSKCGYRDITYWIYRCFERLQKQYEIITKKENDLTVKPSSNSEVISHKV